MIVKILREAGYDEALLGLSLNKKQPLQNMPDAAGRLCKLDDGHNKFLESIDLWLDITFPRYVWQEVDTYRCPEDGEDGFTPTGITKQSESTMHTLLNRPLAQTDFERPIPDSHLNHLNDLVAAKDFTQLKNDLPEGFLQRRIVKTNYKALRHIIRQRRHHRLEQWPQFCEAVKSQCAHPEFLGDL